MNTYYLVDIKIIGYYLPCGDVAEREWKGRKQASTFEVLDQQVLDTMTVTKGTIQDDRFSPSCFMPAHIPKIIVVNLSTLSSSCVVSFDSSMKKWDTDCVKQSHCA